MVNINIFYYKINCGFFSPLDFRILSTLLLKISESVNKLHNNKKINS